MDNFWLNLRKPFMVLAPMANVTDWAFRQIVLECGKPGSRSSEGFLADTYHNLVSLNKNSISQYPNNQTKTQRQSELSLPGGPDVFFTEFISADGICAVGKDKFKGELYFTENERPIVVQFFSANPENMYRCAQLAQELGFDGIDINMGCPDKSVEKQGAGAALMKNPELAVKIIKETIRGARSTSSTSSLQAGSTSSLQASSTSSLQASSTSSLQASLRQTGLPVSVKTRFGYNKIDFDWIEKLLNTEITALSVHLRTRKEMSKVPAHWEEAGKISEIAKKAGKIIIGNGDVKNMEDAIEKANTYDLNGIMIGRGILENPWFFHHGNTEEDGKNRKSNLNTKGGKRTPEERIRLLKMHLENFEKLWGDSPAGEKNFDVMKRFFKIYIAGWPGAKELRVKLMTAKNKNEVNEVVDLSLKKMW